ncbi:MAG: FAD-dependent tricarballylate dehydrogenase TcuA [Candidatus Rokubacteria bacterium]|nr:FAD-dependent tricarballylate dehydrogenase TcuA [Candidatus Rokubacteria bacterium]MBI3107348.1 FAD-dependent tricarballylate dehydrogenase TcuA [Candidatus Rokubacteria bacterium]
MPEWDVIVVGAGNAALAAAVSAREQGAGRVAVLEKAPVELRGGNTHYSGGLLRFAYDRAEELLPLVPDVEREVPGFLAGVEPYPRDRFRADLARVTEGRTDPELSEILIGRSRETVGWMAKQGIVMEAAVSLSAVRVGDTVKWSPGAVIRAQHEGVGLSRMWFDIAERCGIEIRYDTGAVRLVQDARGRVTGIVVRDPQGFRELSAQAVVLGCGGFEANPEWRARYLGRPWDGAKVRGTRYNAGDGLRMALEIGALPHGQWTGCHSTPIDAAAPPHGDRKLTDKTNRLSYPFGVLVNARGARFVDEGEDFQFYTYAKLGGIILNQPGGVAFQIFDAKVADLLEGRYKTGTPIVADSLRQLVERLPVDRTACLEALEAYNAAVEDGRFDPTVKDGLRTRGLALPKSNWAQRLEAPPLVAYPVTGGITFTFGGVRISERGQVLSTAWAPIPGLYACGEMVGGLFHGNYPGGTGLMSGAVFGRLAGANAAGE